MAYNKYLSTCLYNLILLLAYLYGVLSTCRPPGEFADLSICAEASKTGRAFFMDMRAVPNSSPAVCRCSVNISQSARDIYIFYNYQGGGSRCRNGYQFSLSNISLTCNDIETSVGHFDEINFVLNTSDSIDISCLILHIVRLGTERIKLYNRKLESSIQLHNTCEDRGVPENETYATASISCFENSMTSTTIRPSGIIGMSSTTTQSVSVTTEEEVVFKEFIIIAAAVGVCGAFFLVLTAVLLLYCYRKRRRNSNSGKSTDHVYVNTDREASGKMNNIELFDESPETHVNETAATYDTVDNDTEQRSGHIVTSVLYNNLRTNDYEAAYNTLSLGTGQCTEHVYKSLEIKQSSNRR